jgi:hypothetical protein
MNTNIQSFIIGSAMALTVVVGSSQGRVIHEDFLCFCGGPIFDFELSYDFGTEMDFTGSLDSYDLFTGELWLYSDRTTVTVNTLAPDEYIESIEIMWTDFCEIGCTAIELVGATDNYRVENTLTGSLETVLVTHEDLGEEILSFSIESYEGRVEEFRVTVVPTQSAFALLCLGGTLLLSRRR